MSVDVFGRSLKNGVEVLKGLPGQGFILTGSGNYDIRDKRLCNVGEAVDANDAVNLDLLKVHMQNVKQEFVIKHFNIMMEQLNELEDQILRDKERFVLFTRTVIWPVIQELKKVKVNDQEFQQNLSKITSDVLDYMSL